MPAPEAAGQADLLYLAQPIHRIIDSLAELDAWVKPGALITDAGSTKKAIVDRARQVISRAQFLGGHPMAGRERRGVEAAEADLFQGRPVRADAAIALRNGHSGRARVSRLDSPNWLFSRGFEPR